MSQYKEIIKKLIKINLPVMLWGPPGVGKSQMVKDAAKELGYSLVDMRLQEMSPVDLRGIPVEDKETGRAKWLPPYDLPMEERDGVRGVLFLDELPNADRDVQSVALRLILDRRIGTYELPKQWVPIAAGNRVQDRAGAYSLISSLANRLIHIPVYSSMPSLDIEIKDVEINVEEWRKWAYENDVAEEIVAFISYRPKLLYTVTKQVAYPTPRMWGDYVNKVIKTIGYDREIISGCIGEGPAAEFMAYVKVKNELPDIEKILATGDGEVPTRPDVTYMLVTSLISKIKDLKKQEKKLENAFKYIMKLQKEYQVMFVKDLVNATKSVAELMKKDYMRQWMNENNIIFNI
ncbi:MAG: ATP-binding protein [Thermovenabulum sp.]|uniref:ATP-binding protein n=1 Tax=Thermovenabulum sp. TaxID=3100335 RepID=UPI003C7E31C5